MKFIAAVLGLIVAEEIIQLEPVKASATNVYGCNALSSKANCDLDPYCYWASGASNAAKRCIDDPCLKYTAEGDCVESVIVDDDTNYNVACALRSVANYGGHDCTGDNGSGKVCGQAGTSSAPIDKTSLYTYCEYIQLKDGSCPDSICMKAINGASNDKHCVKNNKVQSDAVPCEFLTQADCKLVPKCYWTSGACAPDPCFQKKPSNVACSGITGGPWTVNFNAGTCVDWHPHSYADGTVLDYCIHKDNADANICYFGIANITDVNNEDYRSDWSSNWRSDPGTYPTYNYGTANPDCLTDGLSHCEGHGNCSTIVNKRGAFAGKYCTDGTHGAANILRIPSLLVLMFILVSIFSS